MCLLSNFVSSTAGSGAERARSPSLQDKPWLTVSFDRDIFMRVRHLSFRQAPEGAGVYAHNGSRFGNLPLSYSLRSNHYPASVQNEQERNFFLPIWAMKLMGGAVETLDPFDSIFESLENSMAAALRVEDITGSHAYLGALDSPEVFQRAPLLSQTMASIIHTIKGGEGPTTMTMYALMHWYWSIWRWMLDPR